MNVPLGTTHGCCAIFQFLNSLRPVPVHPLLHLSSIEGDVLAVASRSPLAPARVEPSPSVKRKRGPTCDCLLVERDAGRGDIPVDVDAVVVAATAAAAAAAAAAAVVAVAHAVDAAAAVVAVAVAALAAVAVAAAAVVAGAAVVAVAVAVARARAFDLRGV